MRNARLVIQFHPKEEGSRQGRTVHVAGVAVSSAVKVLLEGVEDVLDTAVELEVEAFVDAEVVSNDSFH